MSDLTKMTETLQEHLGLSRELLSVAECEHRALRDAADFPAAEFASTRKRLLPLFTSVIDSVRSRREAWSRLSLAERAAHTGIGALLRQNQEVIMRFLMLDRENEQALLRRGLVSATQLPSVNSQRPNFVSEMYRRHSVSRGEEVNGR